MQQKGDFSKDKKKNQSFVQTNKHNEAFFVILLPLMILNDILESYSKLCLQI